MHGAFLIFFAESNTFKKTIRSKASLLGHTPKARRSAATATTKKNGCKFSFQHLVFTGDG